MAYRAQGRTLCAKTGELKHLSNQVSKSTENPLVVASEYGSCGGTGNGVPTYIVFRSNWRGT